MKVLKNLIKTAKTVHDQKLDRWGPRTSTHSVNPVPYDKRLAKKKKFQNLKPNPVVLNDVRIMESGTEKEQFIELCRGVDLRPASVTKNLYCKYSHRNKPYYMYGPRKIEVVSLEPHIAVVHVSYCSKLHFILLKNYILSTFSAFSIKLHIGSRIHTWPFKNVQPYFALLKF
jgi:hypothetical protein